MAAPAGSGKSRLLAHVALAAPGPVAWCGTPDPVPRSERALAGWLWDGLAPAVGRRDRAARSAGIQDALAGPGPAVLVMVDDVHLLEGSDAELALGDLIRRMPARMRLLMASRVDLGLDLSRLRVSGQLVEIGPDDLRFRAWEVEELFRDVYREPLIPEDVATLARRTAGWAAYLQLFHLATARKPIAEKRLVLASLANRARLVQEYLTRHVLAELSADLQDFLIRTSVLRRPTVALCDELLGWEQGSRELLTELERRQLFTDRVDDDSYRYHTVLLSYLEARLVEAIGPKAAREEHRRAALLLERDGLTEEAAAALRQGGGLGGGGADPGASGGSGRLARRGLAGGVAPDRHRDRRPAADGPGPAVSRQRRPRRRGRHDAPGRGRGGLDRGRRAVPPGAGPDRRLDEPGPAGWRRLAGAGPPRHPAPAAGGPAGRGGAGRVRLDVSPRGPRPSLPVTC